MTRAYKKRAAVGRPSSTFSVRLGRFGTDPITVNTLKSGATIGEVLELAGWSVEGSEAIYKNGERVLSTAQVVADDIISIVEHKEAG